MTHQSEILLLSEELLLDAAGAPPRAVRIFPFGLIPTERGTLKFTSASAELIGKQWAAKGRKFGFDYEHSMYDRSVPPAQRVAAGWGDLAVRADGLYVENIDWTPAAAAKITDKEFRYLSPAVKRRKDGEIVAIGNCALTNDPATHAAPALLLSALAPDLEAQDAPLPIHLSAKELPVMTDVQKTKQTALAKQLALACGVFLSAAQAAADSDDDALKRIGAEAASFVPERLSAIRARFPEMDPGQPVLMSAADHSALLQEIEAARPVLLTAQEVTGQQVGLVGALKGLQAKAKAADGVSEAALKAELLSAMIRTPAEGGTGQIHPSDRGTYEAMSLVDLQSYKQVAPCLAPKGKAAPPARSFDGSAPDVTVEQLASADAEMAQLFGATESNPHFKAVTRGR